ncbi:ankyrin repeat domain-containing protein [Actinomadura sp. 6K520]|uniref:ankyrin repeat domain-containing protein n=1 Tax=Actinomadura sp. 6K520 TaxID=2530364 RepID=UPI00104C2A8D|nr:ankyrin repeat domain-containing protein [Actinomadura sp. 6K520]TDE28955.1 ankyrin repeat domain-containing protein [Actinomadura sp. 6K520]
MDTNEWANVRWDDLAQVRARLEAGADPDVVIFGYQRPLDFAAESGTQEVVAELARHVRDVDAQHLGQSALWRAVFENRPDNARALVEAGAAPWRPVMAGWSPGRLSLAGPHPDLFAPARAELSAAEAAAAAEAPRLIQALGDLDHDGSSLACVAGITAAEAARRLQAPIVQAPTQDEEDGLFDDADKSIVGATDVPGGCVIVQPWAYGASMPGMTKALSAGTVCYAMYANPKSGNQGSIGRDGVLEGWDLHPGGWAGANHTADEVLLAYLYLHKAVAFCFAYAGLRPTDTRSITGPFDMWLELPDRDWWH